MCHFWQKLGQKKLYSVNYMKNNSTLRIISSVFKKSTEEENRKLYQSTRKVFITQFLIILAVCLITVAACFFFFTSAMLRTDSKNQLESYGMTLHSIADSMDNLLAVCLDDTVNAVKNSTTLIHMSLLRDDPVFYGMTFTRAKTDLSASISGIGVFSEAIFYIPTADICVSSSGLNGTLYSISARYRSIIMDYLDNRADFSYMSSNLYDYVYYVCDENLIICSEVYRYDDKPVAVLFLVLDKSNIGSFLNRIINQNNPDVTVSIRDHNGRLLWGAEEHTAETVITQTPSFLSWQFEMGVSQNDILEGTSAALSRSLLFALLLVVFITVLNLLVSTYLFKPLYEVSEALRKTGIAADSPSEAIGKISSYQSEISSTLKAISPSVLEKLFSDLIAGEPLTPTYVDNTLKSTASGFVSSAPYLCYSLLNSTINPYEKQTEKLRSCIDRFCNANNLTGYTMQRKENQVVLIVQFNAAETTLLSAKATADRFGKELEDIGYTVSAGHIYHSVLDLGLSYSEACRMQGSKGSENEQEFRIRQMLNWYAEDHKEEADSKKNIIISDTLENTDNLKETILRTVKLLMETIGTYEFINPHMIPDEYNKLLNESFSEGDSRNLLSSAFETLVEAFLSQIRKQKNPYIIQARSFISDNYANKNLSQTITAEALGISTSYLSRLFVSSLGTTYVEYVTKFRLSAAKELLKNTKDPVGTIAERCGFSSDRNFNYTFKKYYGSSPGSWRRDHRNKNNG